MTEERTTVTRTHDGNTHTQTTVYTDGGARGGAGKWLFLVVLVIAAIAGFLAFDRFAGSEIAKDNAVAEAANEVGDAAQKVGDEVTNN